MKIKELVQLFEELAPLRYQESYDNSGLCLGNPSTDITGVLLCLDVTEATVDEAIERNANVIVSHHPVIFSGLKRITGKTAVERIVLKCIKYDIALFSAHTNFDSVLGGVNDMLARKLGLRNTKILSPLKGQLVKVVTFVPQSHAEAVRLALLSGGAGTIGDYDSCSFNTEGTGTFRAREGANPFVGEVGQLHREAEVRVESICTRQSLGKSLAQMLEAHPYEEPAYDIIPLENELSTVGLGMVGELEAPLEPAAFLGLVKERLSCPVLRYSKPGEGPIRRVAVLGGSGASFAAQAVAQGADALVTADVKYHNFFDAQGNILLVDAGHFETEQLTIDVFYDIITKKMVNFAVYKTKHIYNPVNYLFH